MTKRYSCDLHGNEIENCVRTCASVLVPACVTKRTVGSITAKYNDSRLISLDKVKVE